MVIRIKKCKAKYILPPQENSRKRYISHKKVQEFRRRRFLVNILNDDEYKWFSLLEPIIRSLWVQYFRSKKMEDIVFLCIDTKTKRSAIISMIKHSNRTKESLVLVQEHLSSGNTSAIFGPVDDSFLPVGDQYLGQSPRNLLDRPNPRKRRRKFSDSSYNASKFISILNMDCRYKNSNRVVWGLFLKYETVLLLKNCFREGKISTPRTFFI